MSTWRNSLRHSKLCNSVLRYSTNAPEVTGNDEVKPFVFNRNPRNLEKLRIAYKPSGYHLDAPGREFWNKLEISQSNRYVTASVLHFSGLRVVQASTNEWAIKKHLYRCTDTSAYKNLARVFAQRCLETGITNVYCNLNHHSDGKVAVFLSEVENSGLSLTEPSRFFQWRHWDLHRPEKPWEVTE